jgi:hypothetical protein
MDSLERTKRSASATDSWGIIHGLIMHALALSFIGIIILSVTRCLQHEQIGEGFIDDTGIGTTNPHSTAITPTSNKALTNEETELHTKANAILQVIFGLLNAIGGDLHTGKSACFLIFHRWSGGGGSTLLKIHPTTHK